MINLQTPINTLGYGVAGYNILKQLYDFDKSVSLYPIGGIEYNENFIVDCLKNSLSKNKNRPTLKIWHQNDLFSSIAGSKYFGFPIFELDRFDNIEKASLSHCDEIIVCSEWAKSIINQELNIDSKVVPLGVDSEIFKPQKITKNKSTVFLNCGKWEKRKGHDILIECFNLAFKKEDDVELWMMCDNPFIGEKNNEWKSKYQNSKLGNKIKFIPRQKSHEDVARIMNMADCGVFPARAEGWNLELLEMMACGKHVIATNYSGHTQFCNRDNCLLIEVEELEIAFDGVFFDGKKGCWASLMDDQKGNIILNMKHIHEQKQNQKLNLNKNGIETAKNFNWRKTAKEIIKVMYG